MAEKQEADKRQKTPKDQSSSKVEQRAPSPSGERPGPYRFEDWASI